MIVEENAYVQELLLDHQLYQPGSTTSAVPIIPNLAIKKRHMQQMNQADLESAE